MLVLTAPASLVVCNRQLTLVAYSRPNLRRCNSSNITNQRSALMSGVHGARSSYINKPRLSYDFFLSTMRAREVAGSSLTFNHFPHRGETHGR